MKIILATSNRGKIREITEIFAQDEIIPFSDLLGDMEIVEDGEDFAANALIKARAVAKRVDDDDFVVLSDDSGITVPALNNEPGIFSARYAGAGAKDIDNLNKLIKELGKKGLTEAPAFYTAAVAVVTKEAEYVAHGWMHGKVIDRARGDGGFGYDPIFIPKGYDKTLAELDPIVKRRLSHRSKALGLVRPIIELLRSNDA